MNSYSAVTVNGSTFSWIIADDDLRKIGLLIRANPDMRDHAIADMHVIVEMLQEEGLEPDFQSQVIRLNRNAPPSIIITWQGTVNDLERAGQLLDSMVAVLRKQVE